MLSILISILIFGWVHPGSKLVLDQGIPLSYFCLLFVGWRVFLTLPLVVGENWGSLRSWLRAMFTWRDRANWPWKLLSVLVFFGLIGALLQFFEFLAIGEGVSPGTVTFLMYTYPLWILSVEAVRSRSISWLSIISLAALLGGMVLLTGASLQEVPLRVMIFPVLAGLCIALWIFLSRYLRKNTGMSAMSLSLCYDSLSLLALLLIFAGQWRADLSEFQSWMNWPNHLSLFAFSLLVGLLPNLLFYHGSRVVSAHRSSLLMTFEPVLSTLYASMIWGGRLSLGFWLGGALILFVHIFSYQREEIAKK